MTIHAIYENGVFKPTEAVDLPEKTEVEVTILAKATEDANLDAIYSVLGQRFRSGRTDIAARHNEHQP